MLGVLAIVVAAFLWGTTGVAAKVSFERGASPEGIMAVRLALATPIYLALAFRRRRRRTSRYVAALGLAVLGPYHVIYYYAVKHVGVSTASLMLYTHPVLVAVLASYLLRESVTPRVALALVLSVAGAALVCAGELRVEPVGLAFAASSSALFALYVVLSRRIIDVVSDPPEVALGSSVWALPTVLAIYFANPANWSFAWISPEVIAIGAYLAVFVTAVAYALYMIGLRAVGASRATIIAMVEPLTATVLSRVLFGEEITGLKVLGGVLIALGVTLVARSIAQRGGSRTPEVPAGSAGRCGRGPSISRLSGDVYVTR